MNSGEGNYVVDRMPLVDRQIEEMVRAAPNFQSRHNLLNLLRRVYAELVDSPLEFGDPTRRTKKDNGLICHRMVESIVVHFVVFENEKVVCILNIAPIP